jgi:hypothetical protein
MSKAVKENHFTIKKIKGFKKRLKFCDGTMIAFHIPSSFETIFPSVYWLNSVITVYAGVLVIILFILELNLLFKLYDEYYLKPH